MKLIGFLGILSIISFMSSLAVYCLLVSGSQADDELLGNFQYMDEEERRKFFNDSNN